MLGDMLDLIKRCQLRANYTSCRHSIVRGRDGILNIMPSSQVTRYLILETFYPVKAIL